MTVAIMFRKKFGTTIPSNTYHKYAYYIPYMLLKEFKYLHDYMTDLKNRYIFITYE